MSDMRHTLSELTRSAVDQAWSCRREVTSRNQAHERHRCEAYGIRFDSSYRKCFHRECIPAWGAPHRGDPGSSTFRRGHFAYTANSLSEPKLTIAYQSRNVCNIVRMRWRVWDRQATQTRRSRRRQLLNCCRGSKTSPNEPQLHWFYCRLATRRLEKFRGEM